MTNPRAFPRPGSNWMEEKETNRYAKVQDGMTLLDYFAGQAIAGMIEPDRPVYMAARSYEIAKAMLKERIKAMKELKDEEAKE